MALPWPKVFGVTVCGVKGIGVNDRGGPTGAAKMTSASLAAIKI